MCGATMAHTDRPLRHPPEDPPDTPRGLRGCITEDAGRRGHGGCGVASRQCAWDVNASMSPLLI